jgi:hypothetical protein
MQYYHQEPDHTLLPYEKPSTGKIFQGQLPTAKVLRAVESWPPEPKSQSLCRDYSDEAIPERDPAFRLPGGTDHAEPTVEALSAAVRLDLARRLEQLGMSHARAAAVASL